MYIRDEVLYVEWCMTFMCANKLYNKDTDFLAYFFHVSMYLFHTKLFFQNAGLCKKALRCILRSHKKYIGFFYHHMYMKYIIPFNITPRTCEIKVSAQATQSFWK